MIRGRGGPVPTATASPQPEKPGASAILQEARAIKDNMQIATSLIVVVIAGFVLWCQFNTKTDDVRSLHLQVMGYNTVEVNDVTLERVNDADLQVNIRFRNDSKAVILLDKAVDQVPSCASVKNIEGGDTFEITVPPTCNGNEIEFIARDAVTLTDEGYRVYVDTRSSEVPLEHFVLLYESHELLNFAIPTVDTLGADERPFDNLENANGRFRSSMAESNGNHGGLHRYDATEREAGVNAG